MAQIFVFAAGALIGFALIGFALIEAVASGGFRHRLREEPSDVRALGASFSFPSVGLVLAGANLAGGLLARPLGSFLATVVYLPTLALEMGIDERIQPELGEQAGQEGRAHREPDEGG